MFFDSLVSFIEIYLSSPLTFALFGLVGFWCLLCIIHCLLNYFSINSIFTVFGSFSVESDPFKFADKVFNNSDLKKAFYSILDRDVEYFEVWYSPNKSDLKKFKKTALLSLKCLIIELFYFESDHESILAFYDSNSFDVVLFSTVLGEHSDLKYYHDLPDFFRTLVTDKEKFLLLKEQIINEKK